MRQHLLSDSIGKYSSSRRSKYPTVLINRKLHCVIFILIFTFLSLWNTSVLFVTTVTENALMTAAKNELSNDSDAKHGQAHPSTDAAGLDQEHAQQQSSRINSTSIPFRTQTTQASTDVARLGQRTEQQPAWYDMASLQLLLERCPNTTEAERRRFVHSFGGNGVAVAERKLKAYMKWRKDHDLDAWIRNVSSFASTGNETNVDVDRFVWEEASKKAINYFKEAPPSHLHPESPVGKLRNKIRKNKIEKGGSKIYQMAHSPTLPNGLPCRDRTDHRVIHTIPAQMDVKTFPTEVYWTAVALYMESIFDRSTAETYTLLIDVRPVAGCPSTPFLEMAGFVREVARALNQLLPGRLHAIIVYPVPRFATLMWNIAKGFLSPSMRDDVLTLVRGEFGWTAPPPNEALKRLLEEKGVEALEETRLSAPCAQVPHQHER